MACLQETRVVLVGENGEVEVYYPHGILADEIKIEFDVQEQVSVSHIEVHACYEIISTIVTELPTSTPVTPCVEFSGMEDPLVIPPEDIRVIGNLGAPVDNLR